MTKTKIIPNIFIHKKFRGHNTSRDNKTYGGNRRSRGGSCDRGSGIETEVIKVDIEAKEVIGICTVGRDIALGPKVKRCHFFREPDHLVREC